MLLRNPVNIIMERMRMAVVTFDAAKKLRTFLIAVLASFLLSLFITVFFLILSGSLGFALFNFCYDYLLLPQMLVIVALVFGLAYYYDKLSVDAIGSTLTLERSSLSKKTGKVHFNGIPFVVKCPGDVIRGRRIEIAGVHRSFWWGVFLVAKN